MRRMPVQVSCAACNQFPVSPTAQLAVHSLYEAEYSDSQTAVSVWQFAVHSTLCSIGTLSAEFFVLRVGLP
jgi:hypothetical protein